jgi:hypothetical protein
LTSSSDAYRRQARRLRCRYADRPDRLHHSLKQLVAATSIRSAAVAPPAAAEAPSAAAATPRRPAAQRARSYADYLVAAMPPSGILRYSQRLEFLRAAPRFGLNRFEANLAIAAIMGRHRPTEAAEEQSPGARPTISAVATFFVVQGVVVLGAWWTLYR